MSNLTSQIRKAAVLVRTLDADTAAALLGRLSPEEAAALRAALRSLGPTDPEEQADVAAEFRRAAPMVVDRGVELQLTAGAVPPDRGSSRFEFLEQAPIDALVPCLAKEHVQTIAVVLSYLRPTRAAEVLAALPPHLQADVIQRLSALGQSDPDSLTVLERELAAWLEGQQSGPSRRARRTDAVAAILAAAQQTARQGIIDNLKQHNRRLADDLARLLPPVGGLAQAAGGFTRRLAVGGLSEAAGSFTRRPESAPETPPTPAPRPTLALRFDDLARLGTDELSAVLRHVDANVLVLALAGSSDELVDVVTGRMPRKVAKAFRRQLRRLGPTRLRDVEAAQAAVAAVATRLVQTRRYPRPIAA